MRGLIAGVMTVALLCAQGAATAAEAASSCVRPIEKSAFDLTGLKSELMVTALSCSQQDKYNAFVMRFRTSLVASDRALNTYFGRAFGRAGQSEHDDYVTSLANQESEDGTKLGAGFCSQKVGMFDTVLAMAKPADLSTYAAGQSLVQPISVVACPVVLTTRARVVVHHRHRALHS